ncbi:MAG: flagellar hook-associated protein FlgK [Rhodospirillaceae bacterium]|nr:flagellar hook-associated protein FlgK [Rhodospirillaceae bacterium]
MSLEITLQNAISGLQTAKQSLQVISNNVANVNTDGYTKKIVEPTSRVIEGQGYGVELANVTRNVDTGIQRQLLTETGTFERLTVKDDFLRQVNSFFGRPEDNNSITHLISELGAQFDALAVTPETAATQFLAVKTATDVLSELERMSDEIQRLRSDTNLKIESAITEFNTAMDSIVDLNSSVIQFTASNISIADLQDQRDRALTKLSEIMDIKYFEKSDGSMTVFSGGGSTLIDGQKQALSYNRPSSMSPTLVYTKTSATNYLAPGETGHPVGGVPGIFVGEEVKANDITSTLSSGKLKGLLDLRDTDLVSLQSQLDELAEKLKNELNAVHNKGAGYPPVSTLTGDRYVQSATTFSGTGIIRVGIVNDSGVLQEDLNLTMSSYTTVSTLVTALDAMTNLSASVNSDGHLQLSAQNDYRVVINELTSSVSAAGDLSKGFSDFFGLNNLIDSTENYSKYRTNYYTSASTAVVTTGGTLQFSGNDGTAWSTTVSYSANDTLTQLAAAINANGTLTTNEGITAEVVADGDGFRLQISDAGGQEFAVTESASGTVLADSGLRTDVRGISNRLSVRSDIVDSTFLVSRGALQSNTFESSSSLTITDPTAAISGGGVTSGGTLTFTIDASTSTTVSYATTDTLNAVVTAINANSTLQAANITAEAVISGSNYQLKLVDGDADNVWIADSGGSGGLVVDTSQGVTVGDGSVAKLLAAEFATTVTFLTAPADGGGLSQSDTTFADYSASILSYNSAVVSSVETDLNFQANLKNELFSKHTSISGVNMDEELANLIIFEQAYLASARMITVTQELFRSLTDMLR